MHPYIAQQLAGQKEHELRRQAEFARLASPSRRTRRKRLPWSLQWLHPRHKGAGAAPPTDVRGEPFPAHLGEAAPHLDPATSGPIQRDQALC